MTTPLTSEHVTLRGIDFAYWDQGSGPVVLNAHGLTQSRRAAAALNFPDYTPVADGGSRLISYDARGHGESSGTKDPRYYSWAALAQDMLALADHFSPDEPVGVIGCSMGTGTLLHAVTQQPERFSKLVVTAAPTGWETRAAQVEIYKTMADLAENEPEKLAEMRAAAPIAPIFQGLPGFPADPDVTAELLPTIQRGAGLADLPPVSTLSGITQPTLILAWATDPAHPLASSERLAAAIPNSELVVAETWDEVQTWGKRAAEFLNS